MKILATDKVSSLSITSGTVLANWPVSNVQTNQPQERAIASTKSLTIQVALSGSSDAFFLDGWLADSGSYDLDSAGSPTNLTSTQLEDRFGFEPWGQNVVKRRKPLFISGLSANSTIDLTLVTSTDRKDSAISGNGITNWVQSSGATGNFTDGTSNVNIIDHGQVLLGGWVTIGGTDYQIISIAGDGTSSGDISLSGSAASGAVTALNLPIQLGIFRAGSTVDLVNPQSLNRGFVNFSTIRTGASGFRLVSKRGLAQTISVSGIYSQTQADNLVGISASLREQPIAILITENMNIERDSLALFAGISIPQDAYATPGGSHRTLTYNITEVL